MTIILNDCATHLLFFIFLEGLGLVPHAVAASLLVCRNPSQEAHGDEEREKPDGEIEGLDGAEHGVHVIEHLDSGGDGDDLDRVIGVS